MDLQPLYTLLEKGPSAHKGTRASIRKQRAQALHKAAEKVTGVQRAYLKALASAIEQGEAKEACEIFAYLSPAARRVLPRNMAVACGEGRLDLWPMYELV